MHLFCIVHVWAKVTLSPKGNVHPSNGTSSRRARGPFNNSVHNLSTICTQRLSPAGRLLLTPQGKIRATNFERLLAFLSFFRRFIAPRQKMWCQLLYVPVVSTSLCPGLYSWRTFVHLIYPYAEGEEFFFDFKPLLCQKRLFMNENCPALIGEFWGGLVYGRPNQAHQSGLLRSPINLGEVYK